MEKKERQRRVRGTGSLQLKGTTWYARWRANGIAHMESTGVHVGDSRDGKSARELAEEYLMDKTEPLRMRHREDALLIIQRQLQTNKERMNDRMKRIKGKTQVSELGTAFRTSPRRPDCSEDMLDFYCLKVRQFVEKMGDMAAVDVDQATADAYARAMREDNVAAGTYNKAINALSLVWRICGRDIGLDAGMNPWTGITHRKSDTHRRREMTHEETDRLVDSAKGELKKLLAIGLFTGMRLGDCCHLKYENFKDNAVFVVTHKRGKRVAIPVHSKLREAIGETNGHRGYVVPGLAALYDKKNGATFVCRITNGHFQRCGIETSFKMKDGKKTFRKRPDAGFHSLRHSFGTRAIEAGIPPHIVQMILGHSDRRTTEIYTHLNDQDVLQAFEKIS